MRKAAFIYSRELEKYGYPPEHPFNTIRPKKTREIINSMGLLSGEGRSEVAPVPIDRIVLKKFHTPHYLHILKKARPGRWNAEAFDMGLGTEDCPVFRHLYEVSREKWEENPGKDEMKKFLLFASNLWNKMMDLKKTLYPTPQRVESVGVNIELEGDMAERVLRRIVKTKDENNE